MIDDIAALFVAPIPIKLNLDDLVRIASALEHHRQIFLAVGDDAEAEQYERLTKILESYAVPAINILSRADDHANSCVR